VDDFGLEDQVPQNPYLFVLDANTLPHFQGQALFYRPPGEDEHSSRQAWIQNERGYLYELSFDPESTNLPYRIRRRPDIELHNADTHYE